MISVLDIFGICFIVEIAIIVIAIATGIILGAIDRHEKARTYKYMMKHEKEFCNKKTDETKTPDKKIDRTDELGLFLDPSLTGKITSVQQCLKLTPFEASSIEYKLAYVDHMFVRNLRDPDGEKYVLNEDMKTHLYPKQESENVYVFDLPGNNKFKFNMRDGSITDIDLQVPVHLVVKVQPKTCEPILSPEEKQKESDKLNSIIEDIIQK